MRSFVLFNDLFSWVGGGLALVLAYILVSNTLWLLFGARLLQSLPGVDINGIGGTFKIAAMIVLSVIGTLCWLFKYIYSLLVGCMKPVLKEEVGKMIQKGARIVESRRRVNNHRDTDS